MISSCSTSIYFWRFLNFYLFSNSYRSNHFRPFTHTGIIQFFHTIVMLLWQFFCNFFLNDFMVLCNFIFVRSTHWSWGEWSMGQYNYCMSVHLSYPDVNFNPAKAYLSVLWCTHQALLLFPPFLLQFASWQISFRLYFQLHTCSVTTGHTSPLVQIYSKVCAQYRIGMPRLALKNSFIPASLF